MLEPLRKDPRTAAVFTWLFLGLVVLLPVFPIRGFSGTLAGHLIGIAGTLLILFTLIYPFRKRVLNQKGKRNPIDSHILFGLTGPSLVVIHAEHHYGSLTGLLVYLALFLVVLSGIVGRYFFKQVTRSLRDQKKDLYVLKHAFDERRKRIAPGELQTYLASRGLRAFNRKRHGPEEEQDLTVRQYCRQLVEIAELIAETEYTVAMFDRTKVLFSRWIRYHIFLAVFMFALIAVHSLATLYYGLKWLP